MTSKQQIIKPISQVFLFSAIYFIFFGANGVLIPFISLHFYKIGISGVQVGTLTTIRVLVRIFLVLFVGSFFDQTQHKRFSFIFILLLSATCMLLMGWAKSMIPIAILFTINNVGVTSISTIIDNLAYRVASSKDNLKNVGFGFMRLFGSISFAITALIGGYVFENSGISINFITYFVLIVILVGLSIFITNSVFNYDNEKPLPEKRAPFFEVWKILSTNHYLFLMVLALAFTYPLDNGLRHFEPIYMSQLGMRESTIGLAFTLSALSEIPLFFLSDRIVNKFGITNVLISVFIIDLLRRLVVFLYPVGWVVFVFNVLTSLSFTFRLVTTVALIHKFFPQQYSTTALTFVTMTLFGISNIISVLASGILFDSFGGRILYLMSALGCLISVVLSLLAAKKEGNITQPFVLL